MPTLKKSKMRHYQSDDNLDRRDGGDPKAVVLSPMSHATSMPHISVLSDGMMMSPSTQNISKSIYLYVLSTYTYSLLI